MGNLYKLLTKVHANRLKKVIWKVISENQNAFVEGRQIIDLSVIPIELIDSLKKRGCSSILCKFDIEKAYDHINWRFLFCASKNGFLSLWIMRVE